MVCLPEFSRETEPCERERDGLMFKSVDLVKQIVLPNVVGPHPIS